MPHTSAARLRAARLVASPEAGPAVVGEALPTGARAVWAPLALPEEASRGEQREPGEQWEPGVQAAQGEQAAPGVGSDPDTDAFAARLRHRALPSVAAAYTAAHGHPLGLAAELDEQPGPRRWAVTARTAVLVLAALAAVAAAVVTVAVSRGAGQLVTASDATVLPAPVGTPDPRSALSGMPSGMPSGSAPDAASGTTPGAASGTSGTGGDGTTSANGTTPAPGVVVDVVGAVRAPGVVRLAAGSRVADAVAAAGGATSAAQLDSVNLARVLVDGEQVRVLRRGEQQTAEAARPGATGSGGAASAAGSGQVGGQVDGQTVDLNTADVGALDALPGVGPVIAQRIVDWRTEHGRFTSVEQLEDVSGIGPALLAKVRDRVRV